MCCTPIFLDNLILVNKADDPILTPTSSLSNVNIGFDVVIGFIRQDPFCNAKSIVLNRIEGDTITLGTLSLLGGTSSAQYGRGGEGRIAIYYADSLANSGTICAQTSTYCENTSQVPTSTATVIAPTPTKTVTPTPVPQGWYSGRYTYSPSIPHAVTSVKIVLCQANGEYNCFTNSNIDHER